MIRAQDVAVELGVSISTVGRALSDDPRISDETKAKVRRVAERLGYVGNDPARIMRGGSSNLIGLMIPDVSNDFYSSIAQAMSDCFDRHGYRLVLSLTRDDRDVEARHIKELARARATGIILVPTANPRKESRSMLASMHHVQFLRKLPSLGTSWFGIDDEAAISGATSHLIKLGHRRIAYIGGLETLSTGAARVKGYRTALRDAKLEHVAALERLGPPTPHHGEISCRELLAMSEPPTALLTGSVHITQSVIAIAEQLKLNVPNALSIIGFGGSPWFSWWRGGLTAVVPPVYELTTNCALWFLDQVSKHSPSEPAPHTSSSASALIVRQTTSSPPSTRAIGKGLRRRSM